MTDKFSLDEKGICNYCNYYAAAVKSLGTPDDRKRWITNKTNEMKKAGSGKEYDCIIGVSGGVDSSYLAYWAKENDLRPLIVHFDNGWNSELAAQNIHNICKILGFSLNTYVINWEEFKELQLAYFRAGVVDIEALTDHAIIATIYKVAAKYGIKYTLNGFNYATESVMPAGWVFDKNDWENIKDIYKQYGSGKKLATFPHVSFYRKLYYHWFLRLESIQVLNYIPYNKSEAKKVISERMSWRDYGGKHYESVFTKFYQAYILPLRFGIDKRVAHLSNLICSGQITKDQAIEELKAPLYEPHVLQQEKAYVIKKLDLSESDFDAMMKNPVHRHTEFKTEKIMWKRYFKLVSILKFKRSS